MTASAVDDFEPVSRTYVSQGLKLHYLDWGNEGAPILLLLHGNRDHARSWDWTARALRHDWRVIAPDLRGHGDSQWSADGAYISSYHVLDLVDLIDTLGPEPLTIVGHSFGGNVVTRYAASYPQRVRKLVLVDGLGPTPSVLVNWAKQGPAQRTRDWIDQRRDTRAPKRFPTIEAAAARMAAANPHLSEAQVRHLAVHGVRHHADGYGWKYDPLVSAFAPEDFAATGSAVWREVACPTLIFYGVESWTENPEADGRVANFRDHRLLVFEKAGHWVHHDQLDDFVAALRDFL
jgi:pimeloyl-ACP methyl ester carboxylesterase